MPPCFFFSWISSLSFSVNQFNFPSKHFIPTMFACLFYCDQLMTFGHWSRSISYSMPILLVRATAEPGIFRNLAEQITTSMLLSFSVVTCYHNFVIGGKSLVPLQAACKASFFHDLSYLH